MLNEALKDPLDASILFEICYNAAWAKSRELNRDALQELLIAAMDEDATCPDEHLLPLWNFIRNSLAQNVPITWFTKYKPLTEQEEIEKERRDYNTHAIAGAHIVADRTAIVHGMFSDFFTMDDSQEQ